MSEKHKDYCDSHGKCDSVGDSEANVLKTPKSEISIFELLSDQSFEDNLTIRGRNWNSETAFKFDAEVAGETTIRLYKIRQSKINTVLYTKETEGESSVRSISVNKSEVKTHTLKSVKPKTYLTEVPLSTTRGESKFESVTLENLNKIIRSSVGTETLRRLFKSGVQQENIPSPFYSNPKITDSQPEPEFPAVHKKSLEFETESGSLADSTFENFADTRTETFSSKAQIEKDFPIYQDEVSSSKVEAEICPSEFCDEQSLSEITGEDCLTKSESRCESEDQAEISVSKIMSEDFGSEFQSEKCLSGTRVGMQPSDTAHEELVSASSTPEYSFGDTLVQKVSVTYTEGTLTIASKEEHGTYCQNEELLTCDTAENSTPFALQKCVAHTHTEGTLTDDSDEKHLPVIQAVDASDTQTEEQLPNYPAPKPSETHSFEEYFLDTQNKETLHSETEGRFPKGLHLQVSDNYTKKLLSDALDEGHFLGTQTNERLSKDYRIERPAVEVLETPTEGLLFDSSVEKHVHLPDIQTKETSDILPEDHFTDSLPTEVSVILTERRLYNASDVRCSDAQTLERLPDSPAGKRSETQIEVPLPDVSTEEASDSKTEDSFLDDPAVEVLDPSIEGEMSYASVDEHFPDTQTEKDIEERLTATLAGEAANTDAKGLLSDASAEEHIPDFETEETSDVQSEARLPVVPTRVHLSDSPAKETSNILSEEQPSHSPGEEFHFLEKSIPSQASIKKCHSEIQVKEYSSEDLTETTEIQMDLSKHYVQDQHFSEISTCETHADQTESSEVQTEIIRIPSSSIETQNEKCCTKTEIQGSPSELFTYIPNIQDYFTKALTQERTLDDQNEIRQAEKYIPQTQNDVSRAKTEVQQSFAETVEVEYIEAPSKENIWGVVDDLGSSEAQIPECLSAVVTEMTKVRAEVLDTHIQRTEFPEVETEVLGTQTGSSEFQNKVRPARTEIRQCLPEVYGEILENRKSESQTQNPRLEIQNESIKSKTVFLEIITEDRPPLGKNEHLQKVDDDENPLQSTSKTDSLEESCFKTHSKLLEHEELPKDGTKLPEQIPFPENQQRISGMRSESRKRNVPGSPKTVHTETECSSQQPSRSKSVGFSDQEAESQRLVAQRITHENSSADNVEKTQYSNTNGTASPAYVAGDKICEFWPFVSVLNNLEVDLRCNCCFKAISHTFGITLKRRLLAVADFCRIILRKKIFCTKMLQTLRTNTFNTFGSSNKMKCNLCSCAYYCNRDCKNKHSQIHIKECAYLRKAGRFSLPGLCTRLLAQAMWKLEDPSSQKICCTVGNKTYYYRNLPSHKHLLRSNEEIKLHVKEEYDKLRKFVSDRSISFEEFLDLFAKVSRHMAAVIKAPGEDIGIAMYFGLAAIEHSCRPNANITFTGTTAQIVACRDIEVADPHTVTLRFVSLTLNTKERQFSLAVYAREPCNCELCQTGTADEILNEVTDGDIADDVMNTLLDNLYHIDDNLGDSENYEELLNIARETFSAMEGIVGDFNYLRGRMLEYVSDICLRTERYSTAIIYRKRLLNIYRYVFGDNHPAIVNTLLDISALFSETGHPETARDYYREALQSAYNTYGFEHPFFKSIRYVFIQQEESNWKNSNSQLQPDNRKSTTPMYKL